MSDLLTVSFGALSFPEIDPVAVQLGPLAIHWYGLGYVVGILLGWWYARRLVGNERLWAGGKPPMTVADLDDFVLWAAVGIVAGGRIGYILFYDLPRYLANPLDILAVWQGGMSFHGGLLGVTLAMILFAIRRGINPWSLFDTIAIVAPIGIGLVRVANFINAELWGRVTDVPWAFVFPNGGPEPRHPSQLYEAALEGLVLFAVLRLLTHRALRLTTPGFVAGAFICGYGLSRIFAEFFREPDAHIGYLAGGWLTMGMILSTPMVLIGVWAMLRATRKAAPAKAG
ncbi:prolipoprotein diacylglyceryl transferase [Nitratireductor pacificus pht-3B]|uniref:Phosphatidylglycerol--prolipoprotein diacylglyceryl transferase n=1 Tax=Nitratireductor pacificus pht-3B TaxID=391937 RepID=K2LHN9_9HYPH|nr:prolipoprotein diacylglyceryl transferase [Nitratireductor pacificus pht-3B]